MRKKRKNSYHSASIDAVQSAKLGIMVAAPAALASTRPLYLRIKIVKFGESMDAPGYEYI